ncbi:MAG: hypothetical protein ACRET4_10065, partial [Steroidobacteraceae bacterium]
PSRAKARIIRAGDDGRTGAQVLLFTNFHLTRNSMMAEVTLTIEQPLLRSIELRAETLGQSVETAIGELLDIGLRRDIRGRVAVAERIRAMSPNPIEDDSTDIIRRMRDGS